MSAITPDVLYFLPLFHRALLAVLAEYYVTAHPNMKHGVTALTSWSELLLLN